MKSRAKYAWATRDMQSEDMRNFGRKAFLLQKLTGLKRIQTPQNLPYWSLFSKWKPNHEIFCDKLFEMFCWRYATDVLLSPDWFNLCYHNNRENNKNNYEPTCMVVSCVFL